MGSAWAVVHFAGLDVCLVVVSVSERKGHIGERRRRLTASTVIRPFLPHAKAALVSTCIWQPPFGQHLHPFFVQLEIRGTLVTYEHHIPATTFGVLLQTPFARCIQLANIYLSRTKHIVSQATTTLKLNSGYGRTRPTQSTIGALSRRWLLAI